MVSLFKPVVVTPNGTTYEQQEMSSTDKETLDKKIEVPSTIHTAHLPSVTMSAKSRPRFRETSVTMARNTQH